jgi:gamma-glutamyltranspeptidase/glutathione hydrolase
MTAKGVIAAGHPETVGAARAILEEGGNAFDAVLAAVYASAAVEPVLSSLGGGGFLMAYPAEGSQDGPVVYDFFTQTPNNRKPAKEVDFYPMVADFGPATQEFHMGMASMAMPGTVKGLFQVHRDLCTMPMTRIVEPAVALARGGFTVNKLQAYLFRVVGPIYKAKAASRAIFASADDPDELKREGETMTKPDFAHTIEALAREGEDLFYRGDIAARISADCDSGGGVLGTRDFEDYRALKRKPLTVDYRGARLYTNPPPSTGGILIAFALELLKDVDMKSLGFGSHTHLERLAAVMALTNKARVESGLHRTVGEGVDAETLLDPEFLAAYKAEILGRLQTEKGTTHISIIDGAGNAASLTLSNGEGSGYIAPGTGIMLNNMLGEEDINPLGFHQWPAATRPCSMMAPSLVIEDPENGGAAGRGRMAVLGSGGSNRLRTAILQVLVNLLDFSLSVEDAINAPRLHFEGGLLNIESGFGEVPLRRLQVDFPEVKTWDEKNLFFGGVHVAGFDARTGRFMGAGDPRRGGAADII